MRELAGRCDDFTISVDPGADRAGDPAESAEAAFEPVWLELLADGLTFELAGLAPGPAAELPPCAHSYGLGEDVASTWLEALTLRPAPHLAGGESMIPVVRSLACLAASLAHAEGVAAVAWHPARSWCGPGYFRDGMLRWSEGCAFPGRGLTALAVAADGGMHSEGLSLFTGQELRIEPELMLDREEGARIAQRVLDYLIEYGRIDRVRRVTGPGRMPLRLEPSPNGRFVRVWRG